MSQANKLGREKVSVESLAAWLNFMLSGKFDSHEVIHEEGCDQVTLSFRLRVGGFVQEVLDQVGWWELLPARQKDDAARLLLMLRERVNGAEQARRAEISRRAGLSAGGAESGEFGVASA